MTAKWVVLLACFVASRTAVRRSPPQHRTRAPNREVSGGRQSRSGLDAAMARIASGEAGLLMSVKLDRIARSVSTFGDVLDRAKARESTVVVLDLDLDLTSASGRMVASVVASVAESERHRIGENTSAALAFGKSQGMQLGKPSPVDDIARARLVELRDSALSWRQTADALNAEGITTGGPVGTWHPTSVRRTYLASVEAQAA